MRIHYLFVSFWPLCSLNMLSLFYQEPEEPWSRPREVSWVSHRQFVAHGVESWNYCRSGNSTFSICHPSSSLLEIGQLLQNHEINPSNCRCALCWTSSWREESDISRLHIFIYGNVRTSPILVQRCISPIPSAKKRYRSTNSLLLVSYT